MIRRGVLDLWARIDALRAAGMAVLMTTHAMAEAERCDRIGVIDKGRLLAIGTRTELAMAHGGHAHADLEHVFLTLTGRALRDAVLPARPRGFYACPGGRHERRCRSRSPRRCGGAS